MKNRNDLLDQEDLKSLLDNIRPGPRNHLISTCPLCGKDKHFYINKVTQQWDCKKCGEDGNIKTLLIRLDKLFLLGEFKSIERGRIHSLNEEEEDEEDVIKSLKVEERKMPIGFKRVYEDDYLKGRKFKSKNFKKIRIGYTSLKHSLKDYVIFAVDEEDGCKGYLARITWSKEKIKAYEKETGKKVARYRNDKGAKFSQLLFGFDEIVEDVTKTVILVEGAIDKITLDNDLELDSHNDIKCCCTFGKKISKFQILKLLSKGITDIILIFDYDAISEMKKHGVVLSNFFNVRIGFTMNKDINESSTREVLKIFSNLKNPNDFSRKVVKVLK